MKPYFRPNEELAYNKNRNLRKYSKKWGKSVFFYIFGAEKKNHNFFPDYAMELFFSLKLEDHKGLIWS